MNATTAPRPSGMLCQVLASPNPLEFFDETVPAVSMAVGSCWSLPWCFILYINVLWMYMVYNVFFLIKAISVYLIDKGQNHLESRKRKNTWAGMDWILASDWKKSWDLKFQIREYLLFDKKLHHCFRWLILLHWEVIVVARSGAGRVSHCSLVRE